MDRLHCWHEAFEQLISPAGAGDVAGESVRWFWTSYGFRISDAMKGDPILPTAMKTLLPPYAGSAHTLYRGEARDRHQSHVYGMSWTTNIEVARMMAQRQDPPGVVLKLDASVVSHRALRDPVG